MTTERLEEIKRREQAASKGPWARDKSDHTGSQVIARGNHVIGWHHRHGRQIDSQVVNDWEFMAHARQDVPDLVAEVERLKKVLDQAISVSELGSHCPGWMSCERNDEIEASGYPELAAYLKEKP